MSLFIPSFICVVLLFIHSWVYRGKNVTLLFFISSYIIKALKGFVDLRAAAAGRDYLPSFGFILNFNGAPYGSFLIVLPIGWTFSHYISWCIAESILKNNPKKRDALFPTVALSIIGNGLIGLCMEVVNIGIQWWIWYPEQQTDGIQEPIWGLLQYFYVWGLFSLHFYYFFFIFYLKGPRQRILVIGALVYFIIFLLVFTSLSESLKTLIFSTLLLSQIPLYFVNSVKLKPMRKDC